MRDAKYTARCIANIIKDYEKVRGRVFYNEKILFIKKLLRSINSNTQESLSLLQWMEIVDLVYETTTAPDAIVGGKKSKLLFQRLANELQLIPLIQAIVLVQAKLAPNKNGTSEKAFSPLNALLLTSPNPYAAAQAFIMLDELHLLYTSFQDTNLKQQRTIAEVVATHENPLDFCLTIQQLPMMGITSVDERNSTITLLARHHYPSLIVSILEPLKISGILCDKARNSLLALEVWELLPPELRVKPDDKTMVINRYKTMFRISRICELLCKLTSLNKLNNDTFFDLITFADVLSSDRIFSSITWLPIYQFNQTMTDILELCRQEGKIIKVIKAEINSFIEKIITESKAIVAEARTVNQQTFFKPALTLENCRELSCRTQSPLREGGLDHTAQI